MFHVNSVTIQKFFKGEAPSFDIFYAHSLFSVELICSKLNNKTVSRGSGGRGGLNNLVTVIVILVLFEQFLRQILLKFFTPNFEAFNKYDAFCSYILHLCLPKT